MNSQLLVAYAFLWVLLFRTLLGKARLIPAQCTRCGLAFERRELGGVVCSCDR